MGAVRPRLDCLPCILLPATHALLVFIGDGARVTGFAGWRLPHCFYCCCNRSLQRIGCDGGSRTRVGVQHPNALPNVASDARFDHFTVRGVHSACVRACVRASVSNGRVEVMNEVNILKFSEEIDEDKCSSILL